MTTSPEVFSTAMALPFSAKAFPMLKAFCKTPAELYFATNKSPVEPPPTSDNKTAEPKSIV